MPGPLATPTLRIPDYELLRPVGQGSYGDVWLARNALGSLRAVKVVWRRNFEDDRPYEREFHGIRRFEPVSRKHEGLIDVYHVGRNDADGCFYYVMELADDATSTVASDGEYRPLTLREELRVSRRLPIARAIAVGAKLASALDHLHRAGLVHRDIKPSNIIFVDGAPKLADIGLVTGISDARSFVGTEGFVAPEGPGTPGADIYSLGKVLYELGTGLDRNEFPKLPPVGGASGLDAAEFAEFNEILLKACDPDPRSRYRTAGELAGDLILLQGGKSLRRLRRLERQAAFLSRVGIAAAAIALLASGLYFGSFKQFERAKRAEMDARSNVEKLEQQKAEDLFQRDDSSSALAYLAQVVRSNPTNRVAAERLLSALTWRNFILPDIEPMVPDDRPRVVLFSPDEHAVLSGSFAGTVQFWNTANGALDWQFSLRDKGVFDMAWSPDQNRLAATSQGSVAIYDVARRQRVAFGEGHTNRVGSVQFSPDGRRLLTSGYDATARIWDAANAREDGPLIRHAGRIRKAVFSPDGRLVATAALDEKGARMWDAVTGRPTSPLLRHLDRVYDVAFSPDGRQLATASDDGYARVWQVPDGLPLGALAHRAQVNHVVFSPDGATIATTSEDGTAMLWNAITFKPVGQPLRHRAWVKDVDFSPDSLTVVTASEDNTTRLWDATTALPLCEPMRHPQSVETVTFSPSGQRLVTGVSSTAESSLWLWKTISRSAKGLSIPIPGAKRTVRFLGTNGALCAAADGIVQLWARPQGSAAAPTSIPLGLTADEFDLAPDGCHAVVAADRQVWIWDLDRRTAVRGPLTMKSPVMTVRFSPDGTRVAVGTQGGHLQLWHLAPEPGTPEVETCLPQPGQPEPGRDEGVFSARFSPDGRLLVAACRNGRGRLFATGSNRQIAELPHRHWVGAAEFSPDSRRVVTASFDRKAQLWDAATGQPVGESMFHDNDVLSVAFSPDGRRVVTTSRDWTARVWEADTGRPVSEPMRHGGPVHAACFSPDGERVATGAEDHSARLWDAETGQPLSDPFETDGSVEYVAFSGDGARLLVVPATGSGLLVDVLRAELPVPSWLPDLAEAVARQRLNERGMTERVPAERLFQLKRQLSQLDPSHPNTRWANWFLGDPVQRAISPDSALGLADHVQRLLATGTRATLREAIRLSPTNALAHARLALQLVEPQRPDDRREPTEARWHERYARRLQPANPEVLALCDRVAVRLQALPPVSVRSADPKRSP